MANFRLNDSSVFTIGGNTVDCVTEVSLDESVDTYISNCEGTSNHRPVVLGAIQVTGTITFEIESDDDTKLGYVAPATNGAWVFQPNGTTSTDLEITSTNIQITSRNFSASRTALTTGTAGFVCDDLTVGTVGA